MPTGHDRLNTLRQATIDAGREMRREAPRFARIAGAEPTRAVAAFNLFQTPDEIADRMAQRLAGRCGPWLEPSAGLGRLYRAARRVHSGPLTLVESNADCAGELYRQIREDAHDKTAILRQRDFLACDVADLGGPFEAIIMNPPFKQGRDIKHIEHAAQMLAPGGLLVALCYDGVRQRRHLKPLADTWKILPTGSFRQAGTKAEVALLTIAPA